MKELQKTKMTSQKKVPIKRHGVVIVVSRPANRNEKLNVSMRNDREFLMIHRSKQVIAPGALCFPGGGIELGETPEEAAVREFREEIGLEIRLGPQIWKNVTPWNVALTWFAAELTDLSAIPNIEKREVADWKWMSLIDILADPNLLLSNLPFLEKIKNGTITFDQ